MAVVAFKGELDPPGHGGALVPFRGELDPPRALAPELQAPTAPALVPFNGVLDESDDQSGITATAGAGIASGVLGVAESEFRTPETLRRITDTESGRAVRSLVGRGGPASMVGAGAEILHKGAALLEPLTTPIADRIARAREALSGPELADTAIGKPFQELSRQSQKADIAFKKAISNKSVGELWPVLSDARAWAGFVGQAVPSLALAWKSGADLGFIAWLEGMEASSDAADFERRTGQKISDEDFSQAFTQAATINAILEKTGLERIIKAGQAKGVVGRIMAALTSGTFEAATEAGQQVNTNLAELVSYNPEKDILEGVLPSAIGGFGAGAGGAVAAQSLTPRQDQTPAEQLFTPPTEPEPAAPPAPAPAAPTVAPAPPTAKILPFEGELDVPRGTTKAPQTPTPETPAPELIPAVSQNLPPVESGFKPGLNRVPESETITPAQRGPERKVFTPSGAEIGVRLALVDLDDLITSNDETGKINPRFPTELQPRDRTRAASQIQINSMARKLKPELLGDTPTVVQGAPIIGPDGVVESGNARAIALARAYGLGTADNYRAFVKQQLTAHGLDAEAVDALKRPVLVRIRTTPMDMRQRADFARAGNQRVTAAFAPAEQARSDAAKISPADMALFRPSEDGNITADSNRQFIRRFIKNLGETEAGGLLTSDGRFTKQAGDRIQAALFAMAYQDDALTALQSEEADPEIKNILNALTVAAPAFAEARTEEADLGRFNVIKPLVEAVNLVRQAKRDGQAVSEVVGQGQLFGQRDPLVNQLAQFLDANKRSSKRMGAGLRNLGQAITRELRNRGQGRLVGDELELVDLIGEVNARMQKEFGETTQEQLFGSEPSRPFETRPIDRRPFDTRPFDRRAFDTKKRERPRPGELRDEAATYQVNADALQQEELNLEAIPLSLAPDDPLLTPTNERYGVTLENTVDPVRARLQQAWIDERLAEGRTISDRRPIAYVSGGGSASGKGVVIRDLRAGNKIPRSDIVNIDADYFKVERIQEFSEINAAGDGRAADVVHEESSILSKRLLSQAITRKMDLILDRTNGDLAKAAREFKRLRDAGYEIRFFGVTADVETAIARAVRRGRRTNRYVPIKAILETHRGFSLAWQELAASADEAYLLDTSREGRKDLIYKKTADGTVTIVDAVRYNQFQEKERINVEAKDLNQIFTAEGSAEQRTRELEQVPPREPQGREETPAPGVVSPEGIVTEEVAIGLEPGPTTLNLNDRLSGTGEALGTGQLDLFVPRGAAPTADTLAAIRQRVASVRTGFFRSAIRHVIAARDAAHVLSDLRRSAVEQLIALVTDADGRALAILKHSTGTTASIPVFLNTLLPAIHSVPGAKRVWFAHNHPSGNIVQSSADIQLTGKLVEAMQGLGIKPMGMIVVAPGGRTASFYSPTEAAEGETVFRQGAFQSSLTVVPAVRRARIPVLESQIRSVRKEAPLPDSTGKPLPLQFGVVSGPDQAASIVLPIARGRDGIALLDTSHNVVGFLEMPPTEMLKLKTREVGTGGSRILQAIHRTGATDIIPVIQKLEQDQANEAVSNLGAFVEKVVRPVKVLDTIFEGRSGAARVLPRATFHANPFMIVRDTYQAMAQRAIDFFYNKVGFRYGPLRDLPNQDAFLEGHAKLLGRLSSVERVMEKLGNTFKTATPRDQQAAYAFLTSKTGHPSWINDPLIRRNAIAAKRLIIRVGDALVHHKLLSPETMQSHRGEYLPRVYLKYLLGEDVIKAIGSGSKPGDLGYLKQRKDIPAEIRELILGEIKDPSYLAARAAGIPLRDIAIIDFFEQISRNQNWILPQSVVNYNGARVSVYWLKNEAQRLLNQVKFMSPDISPTAGISPRESLFQIARNMDSIADPVIESIGKNPENYKQVPDTRRYGSLRGMWIRKEIFDQIIGARETVPEDASIARKILGFGGYASKATGIWKMSKVALNPPTQIRNAVSNLVLMHLHPQGVPLAMIPIRMTQAISEIAHNGRHWRVALKFGIQQTTFAEQELRVVEREMLARIQNIRDPNLADLAELGAKIAKFAGGTYALIEAIGKTMIIIDAMERQGLGEAEAVKIAQEALFDYSLVPPSVRYLRSAPIGVPFLTFYYKALPAMLKTAVKAPWRFLPYIIIPQLIASMVADDYDVDKEDLEKLKIALPQWLRERGHVMFLPWRDALGRWQALDFGYFMPWSMFAELFNEAKALVSDNRIGKAGDLLGTTGLLGGPVPDLIAAIKTNKDPFTRREIANTADPAKDQVLAWMNYLWKLGAPTFLTEVGFAGHMYRAVTGHVNPRLGPEFGEQMATKGQALARLFGINIYPINPENSVTENIRRMSFEIREVRRRLGQRIRDPNLSDTQRNRLVADFEAEIEARRLQLEAYRDAADFNPKLLDEPRGRGSDAGT